MPKLLILASDTGEGHNSVASALSMAGTAAGLEVSIRKPLEEYGGFNRTLAGLYNALLTRKPQWMSRYFWLINRCRPNESNFLYSHARAFIGKFVDSAKPDIVLSVHPMLNHMVQRFIKEERMGIRCYTFLTDPFPPFWQGWASPYVDRFFVPTPEAMEGLAAIGVPASKILTVPMPVRPQFRPSTTAEIEEFRKEMGIERGSAILINGGARGGGPLLSIYKSVRKAAPDAHILVVCGRNVRLRAQIAQQRDRNTRSFGFLKDIHRYVGGSDLVLTKPGALSTYETLACGVPVLLLGIGVALMPQESGMFRAATEHEFGFAAASLNDVSAIVARGPESWGQLRNRLAQFYRSSSGQELIERIHPSHVHA
jgi:UDP-N-acetylglucosamine:LPS N-acetylglucosamine transferase